MTRAQALKEQGNAAWAAGDAAQAAALYTEARGMARAAESRPQRPKADAV